MPGRPLPSQRQWQKIQESFSPFRSAPRADPAHHLDSEADPDEEK
jgi:hypothetical protein